VNRYDRYPGDYLRDTLTLTAAQDGMYGRLIDYYYTTEKPIPNDDADSVTRCRNDEDRAITQWVLSRFFTLTPLGWRHDRIEREIVKARPRIEAARINGLRGGRPKKEPSGLSLGNPERNPEGTHVESSPSPSPSPSQVSKKKTAPKGDLLEGIDLQVAKDFKALRARLRAPITATAMKGIEREAAKAGMSVQEALRTCCERGWRGFKAEWLDGKSANGRSGTTGYHQLPGEI